MKKLTREDLLSLEEYDQARPAFRKEIMAHKQNRKLGVGPDATLYFEDEKTMRYQVQEMLRIEKIFDAAGIEDELQAYNPLIPDGNNWKATFMLEYSDPEERRQRLGELIGIERKTWVRVGDADKVYPIANEDLERETEDKTSSVHFLRFELTPEMIAAAKSGAPLTVGIDHENYRHETPVPDNVRASLVADLD